jgi:hypothetical protein
MRALWNAVGRGKPDSITSLRHAWVSCLLKHLDRAPILRQPESNEQRRRARASHRAIWPPTPHPLSDRSYTTRAYPPLPQRDPRQDLSPPRTPQPPPSRPIAHPKTANPA